MKTSFLKKAEISKEWILIDATNAVVGRLAAYISLILKGKHKPSYTPHLDCGDNIIVVNAGKVLLTGKKLRNKRYYRHTGYPGGIKFTTPKDILHSEFPERVLRLAVRRMLDRGNLGNAIFKNLYVYSGPLHKHAAQKPRILDFSSLNYKNVRNNV